MTTSTIVVTECNGCGGGVTTVPGPDVTKTAVETDYTTITSLCPVTETKTVGGKVVTVTYTTTEYIKKNGYTTIYETVQGPDVTNTALATDYETITSLCPVTVTTTIAGKETCITYTTTEYIKKNGYTTITETAHAPDVTHSVPVTDFETITSLCPVTVTTTIAGQETCITYTTTEYIKKNAYTTIYETVKQPDQTHVAYETDYETITSLCPVTETKTIGGQVTTITYTTTEYIKKNAYTTIYETQKLPDTTQTAVEVEKSTVTSLCPVTEVKTVNGEVVTRTYTSTSIYVTQVQTVIEETKYLPGNTQTKVEVAQSTVTSLCPVTETHTVNGEVVTKVYTSTQIIVKQIPTTIEAVETIVKTVEGQEVETQYSKVYVTVGGGTVVQTVQAPPTHVVVPETSVVQVPPVTVTNQAPPATTAPVEVHPNAGQSNQAPAVALLAGIVGLLAVF